MLFRSDKKVLHMLRDEYRIKQMTKVSANTLEELVPKLEGVDTKKCLETLKAYNAAVMTDVPAILPTARPVAASMVATVLPGAAARACFVSAASTADQAATYVASCEVPPL